MPIHLNDKQTTLLRTATLTAVIYLAFKYLIPLILPFLLAILLSILIRPVARFLYKKLHIPMGVAVGLVLAVVLGAVGAGAFFLGRMAVEQLVRLGQQLPTLWQSGCDWLWDCCGQMEHSLGLEEGAIVVQLSRFVSGERLMDGQTAGNLFSADGSIIKENLAIRLSTLFRDHLTTVVGTSFQGAITMMKVLVSVVVTIFVTIGATLITTTHLEELKRALDHSRFRQEIGQVVATLSLVGTAYGKTQLVIMLCTVIISAAGLTILGDPYALLWALVIGLVDALPIFGAGTILWPWLIVSLFRRQWVRAAGLTMIYVVSNLTRQWLEARYMGDRIGLSPLENLIAMYIGLQWFGVLGLFLGPIGYLLIKESGREGMKEGEKVEDARAAKANSGQKNS